MKAPLMLLILTLSKHLNCWQIFTCSFGHYLNGSWTLVSVWKIKISCRKSCKWPGNGKALASGLSYKSSLWNKPSWHWSHTCSPPCRPLFIPFSSQTPMFPSTSPSLLAIQVWLRFGGYWSLGGLEIAAGPCWHPGSVLSPRCSSHFPKTPSCSNPKMLIKTQPAGHWAECPHPCSSSVIPVPTPVSLVFQRNSPLNLSHWVVKWIPLVCE